MLASLACLGLATAALAAPVFPPDGFPNPNAAQLAQIEQQAFGTLPNSTTPSNITADSVTSFQLLAFGETVEVVFFTELMNNITQKVKGYEIPSKWNRDIVMAQLQATLAQEQVHQLTASAVLNHTGHSGIRPCGTYTFPVDNIRDAFALAATFTSVVLGTLQDINFHFASSGDISFTRPISAVIANEGEQEGYYRLLGGKIPNELPFVTTSIRDFAFTALQSFVDVSTCPDIGEIGLKTFMPVNVLDVPTSKTEDIRFAVEASQFNSSVTYSLTYINQQNIPVVEAIRDISNQNGIVTFTATFPYDEHLLNGLTIAAVTNSAGPFSTAQDVANAAVFAPGLIIVN